MLSVFPALLTFYPFAPFILRWFLAFSIIILIIRIYRQNELKNKHSKIIKYSSIALLTITSLALILGFLVQIFSLIILILLVISQLNKIFKFNLLSLSSIEFLTIFAISFSLLFLGTGIFAIDLPL